MQRDSHAPFKESLAVSAWRGVRTLVTGGAGLVGSHIVDQLLAAGAEVTVLDNLDAQSHPDGKPVWVSANARFLHGDIRSLSDVKQAVEGVQVVFHQAAFGGFTPKGSLYQDVNVTGTARLFEALSANGSCQKVVVASSQAVYGEGIYRCRLHGTMQPAAHRKSEDLKSGLFTHRCRVCGEAVTALATPEEAVANGQTPYALSKRKEEEISLRLGKQFGIPTVVLRYAVTYGPRQSVFNPYTGVTSIFATLQLCGKPPVVYEDGRQLRDFIYVEDVARANLLVAGLTETDGQIFNVGTGHPKSILEVASLLNELCATSVQPEIRSFRPGDVRDLYLDPAKLARLGFTPAISLREGLRRFAGWIRSLGPLNEYFTEAERTLRQAGLVQS